MPPGSARLLVFVAASGLAHASFALLALRSATRKQASVQQAHVIDLDLVVDDGLSAPYERQPERVEPHPPVVDRAARRPRPAVEGASEAPLPLSPAPPIEVAPRVAPVQIDLSPLAAARSLVDVRSAPAVARTPAAGSHSEAYRPTLDETLRAVAARPALGPDEPELRPQRGGGYSFDGSGFDATIDPDGTVHFDDKYADVKVGLVPRVGNEGTPGLIFFQVVFDLTAWAEAMHGNDPYRSERRWFLEGTAALRERLAREAFRRALARADRALKSDLYRIFHGAGSLPAERGRLAFEIWDQTAEDEVGALARQQIEAYVREHCGEPVACGLDGAGLAALNAHRKSRAPFAPFSR